MASSAADEFALIRQHCHLPLTHTLLGPGDDGALVFTRAKQALVITTDMLVEDVHFLSDVDANDLGWKTMAVNLSDLAAMGAKPKWAVVAACLPQKFANDLWLSAFQKGMKACCQCFNVDVVGGDLTRGDKRVFSVTAFGEVPLAKTLRRDGACENDDIWISGAPGLAALGLANLQGKIVLPATWKKKCRQSLNRPVPRVQLGRALRGLARAAIDVSDGFLSDLNHILEKSHLAAELLWQAFPKDAIRAHAKAGVAAMLCGGDDYELIFCAAKKYRKKIEALGKKLQLPLSRVGHTLPYRSQQPRIILKDQNRLMPLPAVLGFNHFSSPAASKRGGGSARASAKR